MMTLQTIKPWAMVAGMAFAFTAGAGTASDFQAIDTNENGIIEPTEATGHVDVQSRWESLDSNGDDRIDAAEFARFEADEEPDEGTAQAE